MKSWMIAVVVVVVLAVGGGAFFGGMKFRESQLRKDPSALFSLMGGQQGQGTFVRPGNGQFPGAANGAQLGTTGTGQTVQSRGGTMGTIESVEGNVLTIKTSDGKSVKVQTSDTTLVEKTSSVAVGALEVGESIVVSGSTNDDGSITARSIQSLRGMAVGVGDAPSSN